ncbi:MAG: PilZ domain-containing protein [Hyphomicrobiales bacterium]
MPWGAGAAGAVTYSIVEHSPAELASDDRRSDARRRTRLHSGKVVGLDHSFIVECLIRERSEDGARLLLARKVEMPDRIGLFDDAEMSIKTAEVMWHREQEVGIRFTPALDTEIKASDLASLSGQFYAVGS